MVRLKKNVLAILLAAALALSWCRLRQQQRYAVHRFRQR